MYICDIVMECSLVSGLSEILWPGEDTTAVVEPQAKTVSSIVGFCGDDFKSVGSYHETINFRQG